MLKFFATVFRTLTIKLFRKSGIISEQELEIFRPKPQDGHSIGQIADREFLYRRYQPRHLDSNGDLIALYFAFPDKRDKPKSGQSFLLKGIATVFHAFHRNCNDGRPLGPGEWGVLELSVADIPKRIPDPQGKAFYFKAIHAPYETCRAHCELFCSDGPEGHEYVVPGKVVREKLRITLSRRFKPTGAKLIVREASPNLTERNE